MKGPHTHTHSCEVIDKTCLSLFTQAFKKTQLLKNISTTEDQEHPVEVLLVISLNIFSLLLCIHL